ncbi:helix-turn-helix domain-containing protein [Carnobacterium maltaromaticum]|uniref:Helix-turn-helix domain-containing protein n=3 Tax=Carnobacterium maltaromaticum TaxID=2751 RepID=A0AAW9JMB5_CARML|nr:helix-turn-helix domain-containing protein [Carnobacterium maltaromaticum]MDZ5757715.1 helix-turn-helix domain-containing protein [Carnobacterium maltaromaticum]
MIGTSKKTTHIQLNQIKQLVQTKYQGNLEIKSDRQGFSLERNIGFNIQEFTIQILKEEILFVLINTALKNETQDVQLFLEKNYISLSLYYSYQKRLNQFLKKYSIQLIANPYIHFEGEEHKIRLFLYQFYWEFFQGNEWPFEKVSKLDTHKLTDKIQNDMQDGMGVTQKIQLSYAVAICASRIKSGCYIEKEHSLPFKRTDVFLNIFNFYGNVIKTWSHKVPNIENEIVCLWYLSGMFATVSLKDWETADESDANQQAVQLINNLVQNLDFIFKEKNKEQELVCQLLFSIYQEQNYFELIFETNSKELQKQVPSSIFKRINNCVEHLACLMKKDKDNAQSDRLLKRFFDLLLPMIQESLNKVKVKLYTVGTPYDYFLQKKELEMRDKSLMVVENSANEELDLIISDFYLEEEYQVPVFIRSFPSTDNDWELLSNLVSKIKLNLKGVI